MIRDQHVSVVESNQPRNEQSLFTVPRNDNFSDEIIVRGLGGIDCDDVPVEDQR